MTTLFLAFNWTKLWTDSELWPVTASRFYFHSEGHYFFGIKPLFYFLLWCNSRLSDALNLHPIFSARLFYGLNALFVLILCDQILLRAGVKRYPRFLFQLLLLSCSTFLYRSGEVRSDFLVTTLFLIALLGLYLQISRSNKRTIFGLCVILSLLISVKAIFWWGIGTLLFWPILRGASSFNKKKVGFVSLGLLVCFFLLWTTLKSSFLFFAHSFDSNYIGFSYFSWIRLEHILRFVFQNPHVLALIFCGLFLSFRKGIQRDNLALLLYLILFFFYPDPLPFFLASLLPIIVLLALLLNKESDWSYFRSIAMAFALMVLFGVRIVALYEHSSFQQQPVAEWLKSNLARPWILVYDPAGLIPANTVEYWFAGPGEAQWARSTVDQIELQKVDVFLYSQKGMYLEPYLSDGLKKNYLQFGKSIYVRFLDFAELREKPCAQQIELVKLKFDRQLSNGQPLFLREFDAINDHYTEIKNVDEDLCKIQLDQSTHGSRSVLMPLQLKYTPKQDFMELFAYDSSF